ncbi:MAG TPA: alpha/beta fold hydrolase [Pyrinomonadaceae bacterium]
MYVERYGRGEAHSFALHGWGGSHRDFAPLAAHVPARFSLLSADLPGTGCSPAPREWSLGSIAEEICEAVEAFAELDSRRKITLVGSCSGAILALLVAERMEGRVGRLVLVDPFAYMPRYFRLFTNRSIGRRAYDATFANPFGRWITNQALRGRRTPDSDLTASFVETNHEAARRYLALFSELEGVERFERLRLPVDIAYGERTFGAVRKSVEMWRGVWPQAHARRLEGAGHLPLQEAARKLCEIIFDSADGGAEVAYQAEREARV